MMVNGIGGFFIYSTDPARLAAWYDTCFGFDLDQNGMFYQVLIAKDPDGDRPFDTTFAIMEWKRNVVDLGPRSDDDGMYGDQPYMINFRVDSMAETLAHLKNQNVEILGEESFEYGEFAWVRDLDGNRIELYESNGAFL